MRTIFILLAIFSSVCGYAQEEYKKILTDGKVWNLVGYTPDGDREECTYTVYGDMMKDGIACKKVYYGTVDENTDLEKGYFLMYEDDKCLYDFDYDDTPRLLLDFRLKEGDVVLGEGTVVRRDTIVVKGKEYSRITFNFTDRVHERPVCWVEGIGFSVDYFMTSIPKRTCSYCVSSWYVVSCYENGECIFEYDDFFTTNTTNGIKVVEADGICQKTSKMYDLTGKEVSRPQSGGVYIKDGKKIVERH